MALGVLAGMTADRIGLRRSLLIGQLILATASFAAMAVTQPIGLLLLRALEGMGFLLAALAAPSLIRQLVRPSQLPLYLGLWSTYMGTGIALALLGGPLALHWLGWQGWWVLLGLLSCAIALWVRYAIPSDRTRAHAAQASAPCTSGPSTAPLVEATGADAAPPWPLAGGAVVCTVFQPMAGRDRVFARPLRPSGAGGHTSRGADGAGLFH